jgi:hypothetical protein
MRPTPASGAPSIGVNPCNNRLPTRPMSPHITGQRPRSADVASDWRSGDGRQDPAPDSGRVRAHHRPGPDPSAEHHTTTVQQFRSTATPTTTTRRTGPPDNTHRQRPKPFGPHRTKERWPVNPEHRTHSCSVTRNDGSGAEHDAGGTVGDPGQGRGGCLVDRVRQAVDAGDGRGDGG